jgi:lipid-binding SYLF domain-containing protein
MTYRIEEKLMRKFVWIAIVPALLAAACSKPEGKTKEEKQDFVVKMNNDVLALVKEKKKDVSDKLEKAVGYATFSNTSVTFLIAGGGGGYGLATHNGNGQKTFMRIGSGNLGLGLGAKEYRLLLIFNTEASFQKFLQGGWSFGAEADATAKADEDGGSADAAGRAMGKEVESYQLTDAGAILAATLQGGKFYRDKDLN